MSTFRVPLTRDNGAYLYIGDVVLHGGTPYADAATEKGPLTALLFAGVRLVSGTSTVTVRLTLLAVAALTALALAAYVASPTDRAVGLVAGIIFAFLTSTDALQGADPNTEQYGILPIVTAWWLATGPRRSRAAWAGVGSAAAVLINPAFAVLVPVIAFEVWRSSPSDRWPRIAAGTTAGLGLMVVFAVWLLAAGALVQQTLRRVAGAAGLLGSGSLAWAPGDIQAPGLLSVPASGLWLLGLAGCAIGLTDARLRRIAGPAAAWILLVLAKVKLQNYEFPHHYYPALAGIAVGAAAGIAALWPAERRARAGLCALVLIVPVWVYVLGPQREALRLPPHKRQAIQPSAELAAPVAAFVKRSTRPNDRMFVLGANPQVYWLAERRASTRFYDVFGVGDSPARARERERALLRQPPAAVAAVDPPDTSEVAALFALCTYRLAYRVDTARVWLRDTCRSR